MAHRTRTIIVGAGVSGLACARILFDRGEEFVVLSENIGGRVLQSADGAAPLGAFYVRGDYKHVNRFVDRGRRIHSSDTLRHDEMGGYTRWDRRLLSHPLQLARFLVLLARFRRHYRRFKDRSVAMSQREAIAADPLLQRLYHEPATETIQQHRFVDLAAAYIAPGLYASLFLPMDRLTGFKMLLGSLPAIEPIYEFRMRWDDLMAGFAHHIKEATVEAINGDADGYRVDTADGQAWLTDNVVLATDPAEAQRLGELDRINDPVAVNVFEIDGELRPVWSDAGLHLFADDGPTLGIVRQSAGPVLLCSRPPDPDFDKYFARWAILEHHRWAPAFNLAGDVLIECEQSPNLFVIGDHNVCGLEDAFITGIFAANQILDRLEPLAR